ncbi:hypothetical protein DSCO28_34620 [Desulfosarcina ovata subsp. sediminis]|uniref:Uncharacterized protein n=1 Tax=Desulfosarcina ovata subsp. sediminis TaxID=885957 RepID=A0A5K7ZNG1_9BACT|nr:hypothetical protein DSCO28_34620 [Desulfosarcina ovata subsp. sediminis]
MQSRETFFRYPSDGIRTPLSIDTGIFVKKGGMCVFSISIVLVVPIYLSCQMQKDDYSNLRIGNFIN